MTGRTAGIWGIAALVLLAGCLADEQVAKQQEAVSVPGPWVISPETLAIGDVQYVPYTGAGAWTGSDACSGSMMEGTRQLRSWMMEAFPQIDSIGGYSCRAIVGDSSRMSVHGTGRALDIMLPLHAGDADNDLGDPIGEWLIENAEDIGIQYIIWDRWTWMAARTPGEKDRLYGGTHPHHDHLHVELSVDGGNATTPWFTGPMTPPEIECEALPADGGVVDQTSTCFQAFGPATYWRHETTGHGGTLLWTNAFESDMPSNWARWHLNPSEAGDYSVQVWAEPGFAVHSATRYTVRHGGTETTVEIDQSAGGWIDLGVFGFEAGAGQHVSVYDNSLAPVEPEQHIAADAIQLVRADGSVDGGDTGTDVTRPGTIQSTPLVYPVPRMDGGDPTLDDDPLPDDPRYMPSASVKGGCSATGTGGGEGLATVLALMAVLLLGRRRRL